MYLPAHFAETRVPVLHDAIRGTGLATLVTQGAAGLEASHVPMLLDDAPAPYGTLIGHVARDNPQWHSGGDALAIFLGADAYVSPSVYETKRRTGKAVPTWNYVAIHAYGKVAFFDDEARLRDIVTRLTVRHEAGRPAPWAVSDAPEDYVRSMLKAIVGFALPIARLEGKWKMSQNRPPEDRAGVVETLHREGRDDVAAMVAAAKPSP
ncbi:MAG TPA: FMN-binding negative transcriptional regulator [Stellaceae bacterium]|nr:FMN-binding negative transcriptional regulator [Stellaceae bacterium]